MVLTKQLEDRSQAEPNKSSALDLAIVSSSLFEYVEKLDIDSELKLTPGRNDGNDHMKYSDHRSIHLKMKNLPLKQNIEMKSMKNKKKLFGTSIRKVVGIIIIL